MKLVDLLADKRRDILLSDGRTLYIPDDLNSLATGDTGEYKAATDSDGKLVIYWLQGDVWKKVLWQV